MQKLKFAIQEKTKYLNQAIQYEEEQEDSNDQEFEEGRITSLMDQKNYVIHLFEELLNDEQTNQYFQSKCQFELGSLVDYDPFIQQSKTSVIQYLRQPINDINEYSKILELGLEIEAYLVEINQINKDWILELIEILFSNQLESETTYSSCCLIVQHLDTNDTQFILKLANTFSSKEMKWLLLYTSITFTHTCQLELSKRKSWLEQT